MKVDFFAVLPEHEQIHKRLMNWALTVRDHHQPNWVSSPLWRLAKSNSRQRHPPEYRPTADIQDGWKMERLIASLPFVERYAIRWCYVYNTNPAKACRILGISKSGLGNAINKGRQMLINLLTS